MALRIYTREMQRSFNTSFTRWWTLALGNIDLHSLAKLSCKWDAMLGRFIVFLLRGSQPFKIYFFSPLLQLSTKLWRTFSKCCSLVNTKRRVWNTLSSRVYILSYMVPYVFFISPFSKPYKKCDAGEFIGQKGASNLFLGVRDVYLSIQAYLTQWRQKSSKKP